MYDTGSCVGNYSSTKVKGVTFWQTLVEFTTTKENIPRLVALPSARRKNGGRLFSGVRKHRKQGGPTLGGTGVLV